MSDQNDSQSQPVRDTELYTNHPTFYYEDGSIILIVERTLFRVHQSLLSRHSEVFKVMFSLRQPQDALKVDGCDSVTLEGDTLGDVEDVMKTLYDPFHFDDLKPDADLVALLDFVSGILRITTKYDMQKIRKKCINILLDKFPTTLEGCDGVLISEYRYKTRHIVRAITLAREANVPQILPWAYYICTHIAIEELMNDTVLSWKDKALCLAGKERLWQAQKTMTHAFLFDFTRSEQCTTLCHPRPPVIGWRDTETLRLNPHPLEVYNGWSSLKICPNCQRLFETQHKEGRMRLWQMLPEIFHLGTWDSIRNDVDSEDMSAERGG